MPTMVNNQEAERATYKHKHFKYINKNVQISKSRASFICKGKANLPTGSADHTPEARNMVQYRSS